MYLIRYEPMTAISAPPGVGERVRRLREAMGLSLRDLAVRSGVSAPTVSQLERGESSPTLAVAAKIAAGLGLTLSQLLRLDEEPHVAVVPQRARRRVRRDGHTFEEVTPSIPGQPHIVTEHTLRAGASTGGPSDPPLHEPGSRETLLVRSGVLALICAGERYELGRGDAVTFDADLPHHLENPGRNPSTFLAVVTKGLRRA